MEDTILKPETPDQLKAESGSLCADLLAAWIDTLIEYMDEGSGQMVGLVSLPKGDRQESDCALFDHEYVEQSCAYEDTYHGHIYFPIGEQHVGYLKIYFCS